MKSHYTVLITLRKIIRAIDLYSKKLVRDTGLTGPQLLLMQSIADNGELAVGSLANNVSLSQATVTSILDRLETRGYILRTRSTEDKRRVLVTLTEQGHSALAVAPDLIQQEFIERFKQLEEWEQTMIVSSLQRVASMMNAEEIDAAPVLTTQTQVDSYPVNNEPLPGRGKGEKSVANE